MIGRIVGDFEIVRELGRGGMGSVYEAKDRMLGRRVAVKVVHPELGRDPVLIERFQKEARALALLNHPNVTSVYSLFRDGEQYFLVMEYVEGRSLEERLRAEGALAWKESVDLVIGALEGLRHAHQQGIVHRDLKPANLFLPAAGGIKIMDFGIAHVLGQRRLTRTGNVIGTLAYMSPEQVGGREIDARSDLYSLGIVLYEMVTGALPFQADSDYELMRAQLEKPPPSPRGFAPSTPLWLEEQIVRALAKDPRQRHHGAAEFAADLRHGLERNVVLESGPTRVLSGPPPTALAAAPPSGPRAAAPYTSDPTPYTPPPVAPLETGTGTGGRRFQLIPTATAALLAIAAVVVVLALLPSGTGPEPATEQVLAVPPAPRGSGARQPPKREPPPKIMPAPPPPVKASSSGTVKAPPPPPPPPPPAKVASPLPPPPPVVRASPPPPAVETYSAPASPARPLPTDRDEAFGEVGVIARRMPSVSERLTDYYDEYLETLEDTDESRLRAEDWILEERFDELLEATERLRAAYNVAAQREGKSKKRGLRKLATRVRATWSAADRDTVLQRIEELEREREAVDGLMRKANSDEHARELWQQIRDDVTHLERLKSELR